MISPELACWFELYVSSEELPAYWPNWGYTVLGFIEVVRAPKYGAASRLSKRIEPEKSTMMAVSRGRWAAVAIALAFRLVIPKTLAKNEGCWAVTVAWTRFQLSPVFP